MANRTWTFVLDGSSHTVRLEHGAVWGKRALYLDGQLVEQTRKLVDTGSRHDFQVGGRPGVAWVRTNGVSFTYELEVDGWLVELQNQTIPAGRGPAGTPMGLAAAAAEGHIRMLHEIRSWGFWSLGLGVAHIALAGFLSAPWGILLALVGLASFLFHDAAMFVVYGTTLAWAAIWNLLSGSAGWAVFAAFQAYLVVRVVQQFFQFRQVQRAHGALTGEVLKDPAGGRAARVFPWLGCLLGLLSLAAAQGLFVTLILLGERAPYAVLGFLIEGVVNLAVLGLAVCLASLLAGFRYKILAGFGAAGSILVLILRLALAVLG